MKTLIKSPSEIAEYIADRIVSKVIEKPNSVIAIDANETLSDIYVAIVSEIRNRNADISAVKFVVINEFDTESSISRESLLKRSLFEELSISNENIIVPCADNESSIDGLLSTFGGIDFAVMTIMNNGAVGFNEPATPFDSLTHMQLLTDSTKAFYQVLSADGEIPDNGYTLGIKTLFLSKNVILVALGASKAGIVHKVVYGKTIPYVPASMFQMHASFDLCLDSEAASEI